MIARISGGFTRVGTYLREVLDELKKVVWPEGRKVASLTSVVVVMVALVSSFLYGLDLLFGLGMKWVLLQR
jgi:preprotein translocase subunit SecE